MTAYQVPAGQDGLTATVTAADPAVVTWPFAAVVAAVSVRPTGSAARIGFRGSAAPGANGVSTYPAGQTTTIRVQAEATPITMHVAADANITVEIVGYRSTGVLISEPYLAGTVGPGGTVADATTSTKGVAVLMGGTASAPTVPWGSVTGGPTTLPPTDGSITNAKVATNAAISLDKTADGTTNRVFTSTEKTKLAGVATGATANPNAASIPDFVEAVQDAVAALLGAGSNVILNYDDAANSLTISATGAGGTGLDAEQVRDAIGVALVGVGNIAVTVNDAADTITISTTATQNATDAALRDRDSHTDGATYKGYTAIEKTKLAGIASGATAYTDELAQDAAAALFTGGSHSGFSIVYDDAGNRVNATAVPVVADWAASTAYAAGRVVAYQGVLYKAKVSFTSGSSFAASNWDIVGTPGNVIVYNYTGGVYVAAPGNVDNGTAPRLYIGSVDPSTLSGYVARTGDAWVSPGDYPTRTEMNSAIASGSAGSAPWLGVAETCPFVTTGNVVLGAANRTIFTRVLRGSVTTATKIGVGVWTQSGNISVAVYRNTGTGMNALPGVQASTSGSVACPASGYQEIALQTPVSVAEGDWLALSVDNTTFATYAAGNGTGSGLFKHLACYADSAFPAPSPAPASTSLVAVGRQIHLVAVA